MTKSSAFILGMVMLMIVFIMMWFSKDDTQYGAIITGIVSLTTLYMGANVADHGVKGKCYRAELDTRKEN